LKCPNCGTEVSEGDRFCSDCGASLGPSGKETEAVALYCRKCGSKLPEGATYCTNCGTPLRAAPPVAPEARLRLAGWGERFLAWLMDIIIVGILLLPVKRFLLLAAWPGFVWAPDFLRWIPFVDLGLDNIVHFLYWTTMEGSFGQSIGKVIMKIGVKQLSGEPTDMMHAAIESIGKAFLLPIDCIVGWLFYPRKKQRLFSYLSETVVVRTPVIGLRR